MCSYIYMVEDHNISIVLVNLLVTRSEFFNFWEKLINNLTIYHIKIGMRPESKRHNLSPNGPSCLLFGEHSQRMK